MCHPVTWQAKYKATSAGEGEIIYYRYHSKRMHTYSQRATEAGPVPTSFSYVPDKNYKLIGTTEETGAHEEFVQAFDAKIFVFKDKAEFKQKIKLNGKGATTIKCMVEFMCCDDKMCLPPKTAELVVKVQ